MVRRDPPTSSDSATGPKRVLSLFDTTNLIVGIIVGAGIFVAAPVVARGAGSTGALLALWFVGGLLSFLGGTINLVGQRETMLA